jgi:hypothetical protein
VYIAAIANPRSALLPSTRFGPIGGVTDVYVGKFNAEGILQWAATIGGKNSDEAFAIALDKDGNVYAAGLTSSADFPTTPAALKKSLEAMDRQDAFVCKLDPQGRELVYATLLGGPSAHWR